MKPVKGIWIHFVCFVSFIITKGNMDWFYPGTHRKLWNLTSIKRIQKCPISIQFDISIVNRIVSFFQRSSKTCIKNLVLFNNKWKHWLIFHFTFVNVGIILCMILIMHIKYISVKLKMCVFHLYFYCSNLEFLCDSVIWCCLYTLWTY